MTAPTRKRLIEVDEEVSPFVMMRVGIFEHFKNKSMDSDMIVAFTFLLHLCDWETGVWWGCAAKLAAAMNNVWSVKKVERILKRLAERKYIDAQYKKGDYGSYDILINNFTPTKGPNALKVKLRQVQAGNPLTSDTVVGGEVGTNLSEGGHENVGGSDKNVLGVGTNLSEGGHDFVGGTDKNVLLFNNSFQESSQESPQAINDRVGITTHPPTVFDEEEA